MGQARNIGKTSSVHQFRHNGIRELRIHLTSNFQSGLALAAEGRERRLQIFEAVGPHDAGDVEHITWLHRAAAIVNLLCDDFRGSFKQNLSVSHLCFQCGTSGQTADEINLADILEDDASASSIRRYHSRQDLYRARSLGSAGSDMAESVDR